VVTIPLNEGVTSACWPLLQFDLVEAAVGMGRIVGFFVGQIAHCEVVFEGR
jgi:hypothetical protein